jgi:hypothetical protein
MLPFLVLCGVMYGVYWVISSRSVEYEYSITNGDIAVDKIIEPQKPQAPHVVRREGDRGDGQVHGERAEAPR